MTARQLLLFDPPRPVVDEASLGRNQLAVLARIDQAGAVGVREAGRLIYRNRGYDPARFTADELTTAGVTVLYSLQRRGLITWCADGRWTRPELLVRGRR